MRHINLQVRAMLSILAVLTMSACATTLKSTVDTADHANLNAFKTYAGIDDDGRLFNSSTQTPEVVGRKDGRRQFGAVLAGNDRIEFVIRFSSEIDLHGTDR